MATKKPIATQIENRNFLQPTGFRFTVNRAPTVSYFGRSVPFKAFRRVNLNILLKIQG